MFINSNNNNNNNNNNHNNNNNRDQGDTNYSWCTWDNPQRICKGTRGIGNKRTSEDHPNYSIIKIEQNTKKSPEDLRRLAVTQTPVEDHQLTLEWKTLIGVK